MANRTNRTVERTEKFVATLRRTGGNVSRACRAEGIARRTAYEWREQDKEFAARWDEAVETGLDELEQEARRRAFKGTAKPVYYKGEEVGHIKEYSDTLMVFLLKGGRPDKYRDRVDMKHSGKVEFENLKQAVLDAMAQHRKDFPDIPEQERLDWFSEDSGIDKVDLVSEASN